MPHVGIRKLLSSLANGGLTGSFVRLDATSDDFSLAVNGVHIARVANGRINSLQLKLARPEVKERLISAMESYSPDKVAELLKYSPDIDYILADIPEQEQPKTNFNPYYAYYRVMGMSASEFNTRFCISAASTPEQILTKKREVIDQLCGDNGITEIDSPHGYGFKRLKREIETVSTPLVQCLRDKISGDVLELMVDAIARRYTPQLAEAMVAATQRLSSVFQELYARSKRYGVLMPKDEQLLTFFSQVFERVFEENTDPLNMLVVACPRYGEHDEYDRLEEGLSQTASTYLYSLPLLTTVLTKNSIPYRGYILVNDTEERMADGSLLDRLGLNPETYRVKCRGNVEAVNQAIAEDERLTKISAHLLTEVFPEFVDVTANLERQLFHLSQSDYGLRLKMAKLSDARLARHTKIMGEKCDFSDSFYLSLHYSAEYMALGHLCRLYPELTSNSFIVNYNSPNVEQFNSLDLLASCMKSNLLSNSINIIPVFQVKYY